MLGKMEAFPRDEWAGLPLRSDGDDRQFLNVVDRSAAPWRKVEIRSSSFTMLLERNLQQKRRQALTLVAFGTLAVTFAVLRCAVQRLPNRKAGDDARSLVGGKRVHEPGACFGGRGFGLERRDSAREALSEEELQHRAWGFMNSFVSIIKSNEPVLARIPVHHRSKILSLLLTLVVQELAALASVLDNSLKESLVHTVREVGVITRRLGTTFTRRTGGVCSRRLQLFLGKVLRRLELSGPQGYLLPSNERLQKLHDLLSLQEVMLVNLKEVLSNLTKEFSCGNDPSDDALAALRDNLGDLLHVRKGHIFRDPVLSRWLLEGENQTKRFAVASPAHVKLLRQKNPPSVQEMIEELMSLSVERREQSTRGQQHTSADVLEAYTLEPVDLLPAKEELQATERPAVLFRDPLVSERIHEVPGVSSQATVPGQSMTAVRNEGWDTVPSRQVSQSLHQHSNEASSASAFRLTPVAEGPARFSLLHYFPGLFLQEWAAVDARIMDKTYSPEEPLEEVFFGSALGEPVPRAPAQQNRAKEAISNPFNLPDMFDYLRGGPDVPLE